MANLVCGALRAPHTKFAKIFTMNICAAHKHLLLAIAGGRLLKAHRDIEGNKIYKLHSLDGPLEIVNPADVETLVEQGLIDSNKKFPAATFWLTEEGKATAQKLSA